MRFTSLEQFTTVCYAASAAVTDSVHASIKIQPGQSNAGVDVFFLLYRSKTLETKVCVFISCVAAKTSPSSQGPTNQKRLNATLFFLLTCLEGGIQMKW